ncbi:MAG TPA: hypothetical protein PKE00_08695, partial [Planctomycetota bacterium]|nr:hypothetical protein [Planctomycetota bacterium]
MEADLRPSDWRMAQVHEPLPTMIMNMPSRTEAALCNVGLTFAALAGLLGTAFSQGSRPNETFSVEEYSGVAMGAHIQGHAATTKYAML